jgi:two-component system sensor histidine kinase AgrC
LNKVPVGGLKGLFYYKFLDIEKFSIRLTLDIDDNLSKIEKLDTVTYKNLVKLLGIYLDNAIEASKKSKEKELEIEIFTKEKTINFVISNTYCNNIDVSKLGNAGYSSKGKNRGYGLALANDILNQGNNIIETKDISSNMYSVFLTIKI